MSWWDYFKGRLALRRLRRWLSAKLWPAVPPTWVYVWEIGRPGVFEWSLGRVVETSSGTGYVMAIDYDKGTIRVGVWSDSAVGRAEQERPGIKAWLP